MPDPAVATSPHACSLAGVDLPAAAPPVLRVEEAREVVVVLPRSRDPEREVRLARCRADGVPVVVRPSGGGAVVLSPGVVAASALLALAPGQHFPEPLFRAFGAAVADAVASLGAPRPTMRGVSDLCLGDRKVAGSSLRLWRERVLYQVSLLVDPDLGLMERYLPMPSRQPDYRADRSHRDFVTTLRAEGLGVPAAVVAAALERSLAALLAAGSLHGLGESV